jgi:hypothetical protein
MMAMKIKQRIVLLIGAFVFVALGLYPPWQSIGSNVEPAGDLAMLGNERGNGDYPSPVAAAAYHHSLGYAPIFRPPELNSSIDATRLTIEWLSLVVLTGAFVLVLGDRETNRKRDSDL